MGDQLKLWVSFFGFVVTGVIAIETRYQNAASADIAHTQLALQVETKAGKDEVRGFRALYIEEQIDDLKFRRFQIEKKTNPTDDDAYLLQKINSRIDKLQKLTRK